jgi:hypothetical protein
MPSLPPPCDLTALFVVIDDAIKELNPVHATGRPALLSDSEMVTILVYNALVMRQKTLKDILRFTEIYHAKDFSRLPKYSAFVEHNQRVLPIMAYLLSETFSQSELNFADSTFLEVCKLQRADYHKVAVNIAEFGKNHQGWHYGFKMHSAIDWDKKFSSIVFTPGNIYDAQMLPKLVKKWMRVIVGDSHYGASVMRKHIWDKYKIIIIAPPHYKQKTKLMAWWQQALLSARSKIESVFDILKEHFHIVTSFPRSELGYFAHYLRVLLGYQFLIVQNSLALR